MPQEDKPNGSGAERRTPRREERRERQGGKTIQTNPRAEQGDDSGSDEVVCRWWEGVGWFGRFPPGDGVEGQAGRRLFLGTELYCRGE